MDAQKYTPHKCKRYLKLTGITSPHANLQHDKLWILMKGHSTPSQMWPQWRVQPCSAFPAGKCFLEESCLLWQLFQNKTLLWFSCLFENYSALSSWPTRCSLWLTGAWVPWCRFINDGFPLFPLRFPEMERESDKDSHYFNNNIHTLWLRAVCGSSCSYIQAHRRLEHTRRNLLCGYHFNYHRLWWLCCR